MPKSTYLPQAKDECYGRDCAMLLSPSKQEPEKNTILLGSEQHPLLQWGEEVALSSGQSLMYA